MAGSGFRAPRDPETNLIYWGTAQAKPWVRAVRGTDGAALYTDSTLALDPDTGKIKWYYQHIPGETQDMDEVFEHVLIDTGGRKSLFEMGKLGILWELDRTTGEFIHATDLGYQNILAVNPQSGKVTYHPDKIPQVGVEVDFCPSTSGFKSWRLMAFSSQTNGRQCTFRSLSTAKKQSMVRVQRRKSSAGRHRDRSVPEELQAPWGRRQSGEFPAMDINTGKNSYWRHRTALRHPMQPRSQLLVVLHSEVTGIVTCMPMMPRQGKFCGKRACRLPPRGFRSRIWRRANSTSAMPVGIGGGSWSTLIGPELGPEIER